MQEACSSISSSRDTCAGAGCVPLSDDPRPRARLPPQATASGRERRDPTPIPGTHVNALLLSESATALRVVVLEDDAPLRSILRRGLTEAGFEASTVATAGELRARLATRPSDLLVVDIGLPDADGRDVVQALRAGGNDTPVLFLTARDALVDRLAGFAAGGDDYLTKPFALAEVVARLRALARRNAAPAAPVPGGIVLDPARHGVSAGAAFVALTPTEFRILGCLAAHAGQVTRRLTLVEAAWPYGAVVHDNTLDVYVARLRRKLAELPDAPTIHTAHGVGYELR